MSNQLENTALDINIIDSLTQEQIRNFITLAEQQIAAVEQVDAPVNHHFSKDVYARELFIPKGCFIVGKIHKHQNLNILSQGDLSIVSIEGCTRVQAPFTVVSPPGVKRLAYAHEDCIWTTIHGTSETDVDVIESIFIAKSYEEVIEYVQKNEITIEVK